MSNMVRDGMDFEICLKVRKYDFDHKELNIYSKNRKNHFQYMNSAPKCMNSSRMITTITQLPILIQI